MQQENLISYIKGLATEEERQAVETWLKEKPENEVDFRQLKALLEKIEAGREGKVARMLILPGKRSKAKFNPFRKDLRRRVLYQLSGISRFDFNSDFLSIGVGVAGQTEEWITLESEGLTELQMLMLPDSSQVWLKENTKLQIFFVVSEKKTEQVELTGEAFFRGDKEIKIVLLLFGREKP